MIILVQINYSKDHSEKILPLGILSVGSALKKYDFDVELININEKEIDKTAKYIADKKPDYVGISVMTGIQAKHSAELSKKIKEESYKIQHNDVRRPKTKNSIFGTSDVKETIKILWGGIHPSLMPKQCLSENYIDFVIIGEGEETIIEFSKNLQQNQSFENILGLGYKQNESIKINSPRPLIQNLENWRLNFNLINLEKFIYKLDKYKRVVAYKASRGCPFNCAFCYNRAFNQSRWRAWSINVVAEDIEYLKNNYKIDAVKFYDDNFFVDKNRAIELLRKINLPSHLEVRIDIIDDELAKELKERQAFDLLIGAESGSDRLLSMINKRITVERIIAAVKSLAKYGVPATYSIIVGLPTETKKEFNETIDLLYQIYKIHPNAKFTLGAYMPYPGSLMYDLAIQHGFKPPAKTEDWGKIDRFRKDFETPWTKGKNIWTIRECFKLITFHLGPVKKWLEFRIKHRFFALPIDIYAIEFLAGLAIEERGWFGRLLRKIYNTKY